MSGGGEPPPEIGFFVESTIITQRPEISETIKRPATEELPMALLENRKKEKNSMLWKTDSRLQIMAHAMYTWNILKIKNYIPYNLEKLFGKRKILRTKTPL